MYVCCFLAVLGKGLNQGHHTWELHPQCRNLDFNRFISFYYFFFNFEIII